jgi:hypothetical protein
MIDVDRPSVEKALLFFQQNYNGDSPNSPNNIPYMFFPLLRKSYTNDERLRILHDHEHFTGKDSVVALRGLRDLDTVITLHNGIHTTIRKLLLSIQAVGTETGSLFVQIERQSTSDWLLCGFHSKDSAKVTVRLSQLDKILRKAVHTDSHAILFGPEMAISFNGQVAPAPNGRARMPRYEVPSQTNTYANQSLQKLYQPTPKRLATEMEQIDQNTVPQERSQTTPRPRPTPSTIQISYANAAAITP